MRRALAVGGLVLLLSASAGSAGVAVWLSGQDAILLVDTARAGGVALTIDLSSTVAPHGFRSAVVERLSALGARRASVRPTRPGRYVVTATGVAAEDASLALQHRGRISLSRAAQHGSRIQIVPTTLGDHITAAGWGKDSGQSTYHFWLEFDPAGSTELKAVTAAAAAACPGSTCWESRLVFWADLPASESTISASTLPIESGGDFILDAHVAESFGGSLEQPGLTKQLAAVTAAFAASGDLGSLPSVREADEIKANPSRLSLYVAVPALLLSLVLVAGLLFFLALLWPRFQAPPGRPTGF